MKALPAAYGQARRAYHENGKRGAQEFAIRSKREQRTATNSRYNKGAMKERALPLRTPAPGREPMPRPLRNQAYCRTRGAARRQALGGPHKYCLPPMRGNSRAADRLPNLSRLKKAGVPIQAAPFFLPFFGAACFVLRRRAKKVFCRKNLRKTLDILPGTEYNN